MNIDLRSDTVTQPTEAMLQAMMTAELGDDVLGDDPTVNALEARVATLLGKEAAVYMPSGTMTNQVGIRVHTEPGDEIVLADNAHVYFYEAGAPAALSGVMPRLLAAPHGIFTGATLRAALRPANLHFPRTKLVCLENTSNRGGGACWPISTIREVLQVAREAGLKLHLDGARLWNAAVATGISEKEYAGYFDTVSVCFSKGLGAPVGSALAGSSADIARARRFRKMFGGGMRQAGVIAAGALYAVEHHRDRLADDHANARRLAEGLAEIPGIEIDPETVETNIVIFKVTTMPAAALVEKLGTDQIRVLATGADTIRAVTHLHISRENIEQVIEISKKLVKSA